MSGEYAKVNPNVERVYYNPNEHRVNAQIHYLNDALAKMPPAVGAEFLASSIASVAYIILESNGPDETKAIFTSLVDEALEQRRRVATDG